MNFKITLGESICLTKKRIVNWKMDIAFYLKIQQFYSSAHNSISLKSFCFIKPFSLSPFSLPPFERPFVFHLKSYFNKIASAEEET